MKTAKRAIYWDTTCWLAWLNDERFWPSNVIIGIQDVVSGVENNEILLFTSAVTRGEIFMGRLDLNQKNQYAQLMRRTNVREINADPRVMDRASQIREYHNARNKKIATPDATHLATAVLYRADEFHTMDGLQKGGSKQRKLLALSGDVGGYNLKVVHPYPWRTVPPQLVTIRGPMFDTVKDEKAKENKPDEQQDQPQPSSFRTGDSSGAGNTAEGKEAEADQATNPEKISLPPRFQ